MMAFLIPVLILAMGLVRVHAIEPPTCTPLVPAVMDNATVDGLLGHWVYIMGASQYPPHMAEMKELKYATFTLYPGRHEDEFNVTEIMRLNETCVVRNTSKIHVFRHNSTLVHEEGQEASMAELIRSDKDLFILKHFKDNHVGLSLSARTPDLTKEQLEEFKAQLRCHGFKLEEAFITSQKLQGMWLYVAGAAQLPQHLLELLLIDHGLLRVEPGSGGELLITQRVAVADRCLSNNSTSIHLGTNGTALLKHARNRTVSSTQRDELVRHAESLGLSQGDVVYAPWRKVHQCFGVL
ncbi:hypothetical protein ASZ78_009635 [Callipepla squamata]|uniref:Uncharacterized protein n=1 Tax=Callipepla squamata TaxID=9009 RepID=A0A226NPZ0_CALSU|nr:hypothetical protein ASZ78_009635 [Callipepla squamata]